MTSPAQFELKIQELATSRKIIPSINMNRVKLIPGHKSATKPYRYSIDEDISSGLVIGPSPGKEVHETIESPEQFIRMREEEHEIRGKSPPLKQFYPRYLQK